MRPSPRSSSRTFSGSCIMIAKIAGALIGRRLASRNSEGRGTLVGFVAPAIARRVTAPVAIVIGAAWLGKKLLDRRRDRAAA
jgi:hypothetical protein